MCSRIWLDFVLRLFSFMIFCCRRLSLTPGFALDIGHLNFLEKASLHGDFMIVGLHTDSVSTC